MNKENIQRKMSTVFEKAKNIRPLLPSVTNYVTAGFVADCQVAAGASAAIVNMPDEVCRLAEKCAAFYINLGTMFPIYEKTIPLAAEKLSEIEKPWVLDPVAAGLGNLRTSLLLELKKYKPPVIRGNASEIIALARLWKTIEGEACDCAIDSSHQSEEALDAAVALAKYTGGAVAVSGVTDYVTDGNQTVVSYGGSVLMERAAGFGCALGGVAAYYLALAPENPFTAALCAVNAFNFAGREAEAKCQAPGSFRVAFLDMLYSLTVDNIVCNSFELRS